MSKIAVFPVVMLIKDTYCHGGKSYPSLEAMEANLSEEERHRLFEWHMAHGLVRKGKRRTGGNAA